MKSKEHKRGSEGQAIIVALIAIIFMAGLGFTLVMWFRAETSQTVQKELHKRADSYAETGIDRGIYRVMTDTGYVWSAGTSETMTVTMVDGTTVSVLIEHIGED